MDQSKALTKILESAELLAMLEEMIEPGKVEALSAISWKGIRVTLKNARETIAESQSVLARDFVQRAKAQGLTQKPASSPSLSTQAPSERPNPVLGQARRDLRSSLERVTE